MSKERDTLQRDIAALEAQLDKRKPRKAQDDSGDILTEIRELEAMVKEACGESFMDDIMDEEIVDVVPDESMGSYMDDDLDDDFDDDLDDDFDDDLDDDLDDESMCMASDDAEDNIDQDSLDDVLQTRKNPSSIVTDPSMLDAAPTGYTARLMSASKRLDRVADYLQQQGQTKLAARIDMIANTIDARIEKEMSDA